MRQAREDEEETQVESYDCSRLGAVAEIVRAYRVFPTGERILVGIDCPWRDYCGVVTLERGVGRADWTKCPHSALRRANDVL